MTSSRIGIVAAAGFRYSPVFDWERPYHEKFPEDTLLSYRHAFASIISSPEHIVLVALDKFDPEESSKTKAVIPSDNGWDSPAAGEDVIVGVGCWKLQEGSPRRGHFQNDTCKYTKSCNSIGLIRSSTLPGPPSNPNRDQHQGHRDIFSQRTKRVEEELVSCPPRRAETQSP